MRNIFTLILAFMILLSCGLKAQSPFYWQNPLPQGNDVNDVFFVNTQTGFAVCTGGIVMKTTNAGAAWSMQDLSTAPGWIFTKVFFIDASTGWIAGYAGSSGIIMKTTNGGATWTKYTGAALTTLRSVFFRGAALGWTVAGDGKVAKTTDGGVTWVNKTTGYTGAWFALYFTSDQNGIILGAAGTAKKTTDGGETWSAVTAPAADLREIFFLSPTVGYLCGTAGKIAKTTDGGSTWTELTSPSTSAAYVDIYFVNSSLGYLVRDAASNGASVYKTTDGGVTWTKPYTTSPVMQALCCWFLNENNGICFGKKGRISFTYDGGINWTPSVIEQSATVKDIFFLNSSLGWAVAYDNAGSFYAKTTNGGKSWAVEINKLFKPNAVFFLNETTGWVSQDNGSVSSTTDGGATWTGKVVNTYGVKVYDVFFVDSQYGWAIASDYFHRTTDGGATWSQTSGSYAGGNQVWFHDRMIGVKDSYEKNYTSDGGVTWVNSTGRALAQGKFNFVNNKIGWCVDNNGIAKTTDGGLTWKMSTLSNIYLRAVAAADTSTLYVAGSAGQIHKSSDGGATWTRIPSMAGVDLYALAVNGGNIWFGGEYGAILSNIAPVTGIHTKRLDNDIPETIHLEQNYPNPFNPSTNIRFALSEGGKVSLKVYDLLGREAALLCEGEFAAGSYETAFNASGLSSGVYFYTLRSGSRSVTKKFTVLK